VGKKMADNLDPELIRQLNENLQQLNTVLPNLAKTAGAAGTKIKNAGTNAATGLGNVAASAASVTKAEEIRAEQEKKYAEAMANFSRSLNSATDSVKGLGKALLSTTQGFTKYGGALDSAGDAAFSLGKNFGILGMALGGAVKAFTMVAKAGLEQADNTLKAVDDITKFGAAGQFNADRFLSLAHEVGLTSKNLNLLTKPLASMSTALTSLGADAGKGAEAFTQMAAISKEERMMYSRLGVSQEELLQNQADFVSLQRASGMQITEQMKRDGSLRKASLEYTDNLLELAAITGKNVDTIKAEQAAALSREETLIQTNIQQREINRLRASGTEEDKARAKVLEDELKARNDLLTTVKAQTGSEKLTDAVANFFATGAINEQNAFLVRMGVPLEEFRERMARGEDVTSDFMNALKKAGDETVDSVGAAGMLSKEVREAFGLEKEFLQFLAGRRDIDEKGARDAAEAKIKAAGEEGKDTAKDVRATLQETERTIQIGLDKVVQEFNPLMKGFGLATAAAGALAAAAGAAAVALGKIAAVGALGGNIKGDSRDALKDKGKVTQGKDGRYRDDKGRFVKAPDAETSKGMFNKAGDALGKTLGVLGKVAAPVGALVGVVSSASEAVEGLEKVEKEKQEGKLTAKEATVKKSEVVGEGAGGAIGGVGGAWAGAATGAAIGSVVPVIGTAIGGIIGAALGTYLGKEVGGMAGGGLGKIIGENLPKMAKGGITKGPTIAGEEGPEAVIPLSENRSVPVDITGLHNEKLLEEISNLSGMIKFLKSDDHIEINKNESASFTAEIEKMKNLLGVQTQEATRRGLDAKSVIDITPIQSIQELTHELLSEKEKELKISTDLSKSFIDVDKVLGNVLVTFNKFNTQLQDVNQEIENVEDKESRFADIIDSSTTEYSNAIKKLSDSMGIKVPEKPVPSAGLKAETTTATKGMEGALGTGLTIPKGQQQEKLFEALKEQGITGGAAQANILAQVQAESGFKSRSENLNYSGKKLFELYGAGNKGGNKVRFQSLEEAEQLAAQGPEAIGNLIYGGRMGNAADEGFKYRGRGLIQLTGKANYEKFGKLLGIDLVENPDLANDPDVAAKIAAAYFKEKEKRGVDLTDIAAVGKAVGYAGGQEETARRAQLAQAFMKGSDTLQAMDGGIFKGPKTGYPVMLHGEELVAPMNSLLKKLMETPAESTTVAAAPAPIETDNSRNEAMNMEMIAMLADKLDTMINKLDDSNNIQDKILRYSQV
jgi:putative chitinase